MCQRLPDVAEVELADDASYECTVVSESTIMVRRCVNVEPDTAGHVDRVAKSPLVSGILERAPVLARRPVEVAVRYSVPLNRPFNSYRAFVFSHNQLGPMHWANVSARPMLTGDAVVESCIAAGAQGIDPVIVAQYASANNIFLIGQTVRLLRGNVPSVTVRVGKYVLSTWPGPMTVATLVVQYGRHRDFDKAFGSAVRHLGRMWPYLVLFCNTFVDGQSIELVDVCDMAQELVPSTAEIVRVLQNGPHTANNIARLLATSKPAINIVLYGRPDLFEVIKGDPVSWKMKRIVGQLV